MQAKIKIANHTQYIEVLDPQQETADLVIGLVVCHRPVAKEWGNALGRLMYPEGVHVETLAEQNREFSISARDDYNFEAIALSRNLLVARALEMGAKYLFFVDDDVEIKADALVILLSTLKMNPRAKVICGLYSKKDPSPNNDVVIWDDNHYWIDTWKPGSVFQIGGAGAGCMLIDTSVFAKIPQPWFGMGRDEDLHFCDAVRRAGYQILAHGGVLCKHFLVHDTPGPVKYSEIVGTTPAGAAPTDLLLTYSGNIQRL